jgi:hypothetical protein
MEEDNPEIDYKEQAREFAASHAKEDPQMILDQLMIWAREISLAEKLRSGKETTPDKVMGHFYGLISAIRGTDDE